MPTALPPAPSMRAGVVRATRLIGPRARRRYLLVVLVQMATALLDLAGVVLVGVTVVLVYAVPAGQHVPSVLANVLDHTGMAETSVATLAVITGVAAAVLLLGKSALNAFTTLRIFRFLAREHVRVTERLARSWFGGDVLGVRSRPDLEIEEALTMSAYSATTGLLGPAAVAVGEASVLVVLSMLLLVVDPIAAILAGVTFGLVALGVHRVLGRWSHDVGATLVAGSIAGRTHLRHALESYRDLRVARRLGFEVSGFTDQTARVARSYADSLYVNNVPKIAYEAALVVGAAIVVSWQAFQSGVVAALALLALFLTAAARLLPTMVRLQGQFVLIKAAVAQAQVAFSVADAMDDEAPGDLGSEVPRLSYPTFEPAIDVVDVSLTYPGTQRPALSGVSLRVEPGSSLVLVGPTGAGKSTLVDLILGVLEPDCGSVAVGGLTPVAAQERWPGAMSYMPQAIVPWDSTIRANVAAGLPIQQIDDAEVWRALEQAHLAAEVRQIGGLDAPVGPSGRLLSGGQRQRLGIARALYSRPRLLVLDEATSALDERTDRLIATMLDDLRGEVTVVAVAHRRSTIERAARVAELREGRIVYLGSPAGSPSLAD